MLSRGVCAAALAVWFAAALGLRAQTTDVEVARVVLPGGAPALLHTARAPAAGPRPVAILAHDLAGNAGQLGHLSRALARAGWAAVSLDLRGHGRNLARFDDDGSNRALQRDLEAALEWLAGFPERLDPARVALIGHGIGARAVLQLGQWDPSAIASLIALAPDADGSGPYPAPNTLVLWGNRDLPGVRATGRAIGARLAGRVQITGEQTYGDPAHGNAVRIAELTGPGHWSLLWSEAARERILEWLRASVPGPEPTSGAVGSAESRAAWALLGWLAFAVLLWDLPRLLRSFWPVDPGAARTPALPRLGAALAAWIAGALLVAFTPAGDLLAPLPLAGAREPLALLALSGTAALVLVPAAWRTDALRHGGTWLGALGLAGALYLGIGPLVSPWVDPWPAPGRLPVIALASLAALPHFAALEWLARAAGWAGGVAALAGRVLAIALLAGLALAGPLADGSLTAARLLLLGAPLLELLALRCAQVAPSPWVAALAQSLFVGWVLGTLFPLDG